MNHEPGAPHIWGQSEPADGNDNGAQDEQWQMINDVNDNEGNYAVGLTRGPSFISDDSFLFFKVVLWTHQHYCVAKQFQKEVHCNKRFLDPISA